MLRHFEAKFRRKNGFRKSKLREEAPSLSHSSDLVVWHYSEAKAVCTFQDDYHDKQAVKRLKNFAMKTINELVAQ